MEVIDSGSGSKALGQAGYAVTSSGGGGEGGRYVFASLKELDAIISEWDALESRIRDRRAKLARAIGLIEPPAEDVMSRLQANTAIFSLQKAETHRKVMEKYAREYLEKLRAARNQYELTDVDNANEVRRAGGE